MVTITEQILQAGMSDRGGWNKAQLEAILPDNEKLGGWFKHGWKMRVIGRKVPENKVQEFLRLKNRHLGHKKREMSEQRTFEQMVGNALEGLPLRIYPISR